MNARTLIAVTLLFTSPSLFAANVNWTNSGTGDWSDGANWSTNPAIPGLDDTAWLNNGGTINVAADAATKNMNIGQSGTLSGNLLDIMSGVTFTTTTSSTVGNNGGLGAATVSGTWDSGGGINVGAGNGTGTFTLNSGGIVTVSGSMTLGNNAGASGTATVAGDVTTTGGFTVGNSGNGDLTLSTGGTITSAGGTIGSGSDSTSTASITGLWNYTGANFTVGSNGSGSVTIEDGGEVKGTGANNVLFGNNAGSLGNLTIKNGGKLTATGGSFFIGNSGEGHLTLETGGLLTTVGANIGSNATGDGTVSISGTWDATTTAFAIAYKGNPSDAGTAVLTIESGGVLKSAVGYLGGGTGVGNTGNGSATVKNGGLWESSQQILVGISDTGSLTVESGGTVKSTEGLLGTVAGGTGTVEISGTWQIGGATPGSSNRLNVGTFGTGNLTVKNGGLVTSYNSILGQVAGGVGNVTVENGGQFQTTQNLSVGGPGTGALLIENGGTVTTAGLGYLGFNAGGEGEATVRGIWTIDGASLTVGNSGNGTLNLGADGLINVNAGAGTVSLGKSNDSVSVLNVGGATSPEGPGTLNAASVSGRIGATVTPLLNFNHTGTNHVFKNTAGDGIVIESNTAVHVHSGVTSLTADSTYTAGTRVHAGTLLVNNASGSGTGTGAVQVDVGATLGGGGFISGATTVDGIISPGNSIGTLTINNDVTWNSNNAWVWELGTAGVDLSNPGTSDLLTIGGTSADFTKGTGTTFAFDFANTGEGGWYRLITWTGSSAFSDGDFQATNLASGLGGSFVMDSGALYLNVVPEPATMGLVLLALAGLLATRRRSVAQ